MNGGAFRIFQRKTGIFYAEDAETRRQFSLKTKDRSEADAHLLALGEARRNPSLNAKIGMLYLGAADPKFNTRTWQDAIDAYQARGGKEETTNRSNRAFASPRFDGLRACVITKTRAEDSSRSWTRRNRPRPSTTFVGSTIWRAILGGCRWQ